MNQQDNQKPIGNKRDRSGANKPSIQSVIIGKAVATESLSDLPVAGAQAEETKGGVGTHTFTVTAKDAFGNCAS